MEHGKVVLITGASSGLGKATAELLSQHAYGVVGTSRRPEAHANPLFAMVQLDVESTESVRSCIGDVLRRWGRIDVLVNNAGFELFGAVEETSIDEARAQFETNFFGMVRMIQPVLGIMRRQGHGRIINMSSASTLIPCPFQAFYVASKSALDAYTEALRYEVAPFNIKVSLVEPAYFRTDFGGRIRRARDTMAPYAPARKHVEELHESRIRRGGDPAAVAQVVLDLLRSDSPRLRTYVPDGQDQTVSEIRHASQIDAYVTRFWQLAPGLGSQ